MAAGTIFASRSTVSGFSLPLTPSPRPHISRGGALNK